MNYDICIYFNNNCYVSVVFLGPLHYHPAPCQCSDIYIKKNNHDPNTQLSCSLLHVQLYSSARSVINTFRFLESGREALLDVANIILCGVIA